MARDPGVQKGEPGAGPVRAGMRKAGSREPGALAEEEVGGLGAALEHRTAHRPAT